MQQRTIQASGLLMIFSSFMIFAIDVILSSRDASWVRIAEVGFTTFDYKKNKGQTAESR